MTAYLTTPRRTSIPTTPRDVPVDVIVLAWRDGSGYLGLRVLLDVIAPNDWTWHLQEFHGVTRVDADINALELENRLQSGGSLVFTWEGLLDFADKVHQLIDGRLSAFVPGDAEPVLIVGALDSTSWKVSGRGQNAAASAAVDRVAALSH